MFAHIKRQSTLLAISSALLLISLSLQGYFGLFSRYLADDFCTHGQFLTKGFLPSLQFWYLNWSGRYSFYSFINLSHWVGPWIAPYLTAATLLAWLALLFVLVRRSLRLFHDPNPAVLAALLAALILLATLEGTPDIYQSLYWHTGVVTYVFPLLFLTGYTGWLLGRVKREPQGRLDWGAWVLSAGITLIAGGFSETYVGMQVAALLIALAVLAVLAPDSVSRSALPVLAGGLLGALAALALVVLAPGNAVRMDFMPERLGILELIFWSLRHAAAFAAKSLINAPIASSAALLAPGLLAFLRFGGDRAAARPQRGKMILALAGVPAVVFILIVATITPSVYATAAYPAERALITAQFLLICGLAGWGWLCGFSLRKYAGKLAPYTALAWALILVLLASTAAISAQKTLSRLPEAQSFASQWDARDQTIRQQAEAGASQISAASLPHISPGLAELSTDANDWFNQCLALSYGLTSVVAK